MRIRMAGVLAGTIAALVFTAVTSYAQLQPCPTDGNCAQVTVGGPSGEVNKGDTIQVPITFAQGSGAGIGELAAIAFTLGIPGLELANCQDGDGDGLPDAFSVPQAIKDGYRVVVENVSNCEGATKPCLCPDSGETMAEYVNIVVYGPKDIPTPGSGSVDIPLIPGGELMTLSLKVQNDATASVTLHAFNETDNQGTSPKPQYGAFLSVGDKNAVDQTADRDTNVSKVKTTDATVTVKQQQLACACDCNVDGKVVGSEITRCVLILGGARLLADCQAGDSNHDTKVSGGDITRGVLGLGAGAACQKY